MERTLVLLKPDCLQRRLLGRILGRFEDKGLNIVAMKLMQLSHDQARCHYAEHVQQPWYPDLERFITSGPLVALVLEGPQAVRVVRQMVGETSGLEAQPGTIRGDFGSSQQLNLVHASDKPQTAAREIPLFFDAAEIHAWQPVLEPWLRTDSERADSKS